jgi:DNA-binding Lrp family transcriptional regulator
VISSADSEFYLTIRCMVCHLENATLFSSSKRYASEGSGVISGFHTLQHESTHLTNYRIMFLYFTVEYVAMPKAFVLMNADLGSEDSIVNELKKLEGVKEVYQVYGVYDIVAQVEANTMERVKETITWKLRKLNGVKSTLTMIVMD